MHLMSRCAKTQGNLFPHATASKARMFGSIQRGSNGLILRVPGMHHFADVVADCFLGLAVC
jgi:hypothetical protein